MKDFTQFDKANEYVLNKDVVLNNYIRYMLTRTQAMFSYSGLPDTIPASKLEMMLQTKGYGFITEIDGNLYALHGSLTGEPDVYEDYTEITVTNVALKLSRTFNLENDGVLINNDTMRLGLLPIFNKYGALLAENTITIHTIDLILRMAIMISASDDRTHAGAEKFIKDIGNGKISAVAESAFFDGVKVHSVANTQNYLSQFIELEQYLKASCYNEIGLNANYNMKREMIGSNEAAMNDDFLLPLVDNMIKERQVAIDKINEKYGTEISIDFASTWKVIHEENEKQIAISESVAEQVEAGVADLSVENHQGVHDINTPTIFLDNSDKAEPEEHEEAIVTSEQEEQEEAEPETSEEAVEDSEPEDEEKDGEEDENS